MTYTKDNKNLYDYFMRELSKRYDEFIKNSTLTVKYKMFDVDGELIIEYGDINKYTEGFNVIYLKKEKVTNKYAFLAILSHEVQHFIQELSEIVGSSGKNIKAIKKQKINKYAADNNIPTDVAGRKIHSSLEVEYFIR